MHRETEDLSFICRSCGQRHAIPFAWHLETPDTWRALPDDARRRSYLDSDFCRIVQPGETSFFIRGIIRIHIHDRPEHFELGVWSSLSETNWNRSIELLETPGREGEPPYFGWLSNEIAPLYQGTTELKLNVHTSPIGERPWIEVEPTDHPLAVDQREGISFERVHEIARLLLHGV